MRGDPESLEKEDQGGPKRGVGVWFHLASFEPHSGFTGDGLEGNEDYALAFDLHWLCVSQNSVLEQHSKGGCEGGQETKLPRASHGD